MYDERPKKWREDVQIIYNTPSERIDLKSDIRYMEDSSCISRFTRVRAVSYVYLR